MLGGVFALSEAIPAVLGPSNILYVRGLNDWGRNQTLDLNSGSGLIGGGKWDESQPF